MSDAAARQLREAYADGKQLVLQVEALAERGALSDCGADDLYDAAASMWQALRRMGQATAQVSEVEGRKGEALATRSASPGRPAQ